MPKTQRPEKNRDYVLNPAMERRHIASSRGQMGRGGVEKDTDQNVNYYENAGRAEKSPQKGHSAHVLSVDICNVKRQVASDPALALG
jgi:hypothetical protein